MPIPMEGIRTLPTLKTKEERIATTLITGQPWESKQRSTQCSPSRIVEGQKEMRDFLQMPPSRQSGHPTIMTQELVQFVQQHMVDDPLVVSRKWSRIIGKQAHVKIIADPTNTIGHLLHFP
jgi:hypothetical protein